MTPPLAASSSSAPFACLSTRAAPGSPSFHSVNFEFDTESCQSPLIIRLKALQYFLLASNSKINFKSPRCDNVISRFAPFREPLGEGVRFEGLSTSLKNCGLRGFAENRPGNLKVLSELTSSVFPVASFFCEFLRGGKRTFHCGKIAFFG